MRISIARWALALACCFSSPAATAATPVSSSAVERSLELELELARTPGLYLRLDPAGGRLEVKIRGLVLDSVRLAGAAVMVHSAGTRGGEAAALPLRWIVSSVPDDSRRRVLEAGRLQAYDDVSPAAPTPAAPEAPQPASRYRVALEEGWELRVGPEVRRSRWLHGPALVASRLRALGSDEGFRPPDLLALALAPEDARRIHHLFRPGVEILAVAASPAATGSEATP